MSAITPDIRDKAREKGFENILQYFEDRMSQHRRFGTELTPHPHQKNINFMVDGETYITVQWRFRSGPDGLHVGVRDDLRGESGRWLYELLPAPEPGSSRWVYSMLKNEAEIDYLLSKA